MKKYVSLQNMKIEKLWETKRERLRRWMMGESAPPYKMIIYPTYECNLNCLFCPNPVTRKKGGYKNKTELTKSQWLKIVTEANRLGVMEWWITGGGEPLLAKSTLGIMKRIKRLNKTAFCMLTTNGTLFTPQIIDDLIRIGWDRITFSLDAVDSDTHNFLRGSPDAFKRVVSSIKLFKQKRDQLGQKTPTLYINAILHGRNCEKLREFITFAHKIGCDGLVFNPIRCHSEVEHQIEKARLKITDEQKQNICHTFLTAKKIANGLGISFEMNTRLVEETSLMTDGGNKINGVGLLSSYCIEPWYGMLIDAYGDVSPCCPAGGRVKKCNVLKESIDEIWFGKFFNLIRNNMIKGKRLKFCQECDAVSISDRLKRELTRFAEEKNKKETYKLIEFSKWVGQLKRTERECWITEVGVKHPETMADHIFRTALLAMIIADNKKMDTEKMIKLALLHDLAETQIPFKKPLKDDEKSIERLLSLLPKEVNEEYLRLWKELKSETTEEAKLVKEIEAFETLVQVSQYKREGYDVKRLERFWNKVKPRIKKSELKELVNLLEPEVKLKVKR